MKNKYLNPWHKSLNVEKPPYYENDAPEVYTYRGVKVFKLGSTHYDYVLNGCCISQRAGFPKTEEERQAIIDDYLDGSQPCSVEVASHITASGGNGLSYEEYNDKVSKGEMK